MSELPPGFVLVQDTPAAPPPLPDGFVVEGSTEHQQAEPHKFGLGDTWPAKMAKSALDAVTLPGDVYSGKVAPGSDEEIGRAFNAATFATPMPAAMRGGETAFGAPVAALTKEELPSGVRAASTAVDLGAPLPVGIASDSKVAQAATKAAQQLPLVGPKIGQEAAKTVEAAGGRVNDIADELSGGVLDRASAGAAMRPSIKGVVEANNGRIGEAFDSLRNMIDQTDPVLLPSTEKALKGIIKERAAAGQTNPEVGLEDIQNLVNKGATFDGLQRAKSDIGNALNFGEANPGFNAGDLKRIYAAMSNDANSVVSQSVKTGVKPADAVQALKDANATAAPIMEFNKTLSKLSGMKTDESLIGSLARAAQDKTGNVKLLAQLRTAMPKEDFEQIAGVALSELGHNAASGRFSLNQFATKWGGLGDRAKAILFSQQHKAALDDIAQLGRHMKDADKFANTSNTAGAASWGKVIAAAAGAGGALLLGDPTKMVAALGAAGGGYMLAKALAKPATASSVGKWAKAANAAQSGQTPGRIALLNIATRNLIRNLAPENQDKLQLAR